MTCIVAKSKAMLKAAGFASWFGVQGFIISRHPWAYNIIVFATQYTNTKMTQQLTTELSAGLQFQLVLNSEAAYHATIQT